MQNGRPLTTTWIWASVLVGSIIRAWYGLHYRLWDGAPDQLAWGLGLEDAISNGHLSYVRLIHYPHEGGSIVLSLLAILFRPLTGIMPPLSWAALLVDTLSRYLQIRIALRVLGKTTGTWFALWSILSVPLLLPWATVDFGLHALIAFAPFLLLRYTSDGASPVKVGLLCAVCIWLAYDCVVLVPAYALWCFLQDRPFRASLEQVGRFGLACALFLVPHVCLRLLLDNGFHLEEMSASSIRGLSMTASPEGSRVGHVVTTWFFTQPASFLLGAISWLSPRALARVVLLFVMIGTIGALIPRRGRSPVVVLLAPVVLCFTILYGIGPFFTDRLDVTSYVLYRHFGFIVPALVLLMIHGFSRIMRAGRYINVAWLACCALASVLYIAGSSLCEPPSYRAAGWVLARKFGHDPTTLVHIATAAPPAYRNEVVIGYGWGTTATLLENRSAGDTVVVSRLARLLAQFEEVDKPLMLEGMRGAFGPGITPVLDKNLLPVLEDRLKRGE